MMSFIAGEHVADDYLPLMLEELALDGVDSRESGWSSPVSDAERAAFHVLVIGAGMSGLLQGMRLEQMGIPFTIVEKNDSVGGTWYENRYPGCRVDIAKPLLFVLVRAEPALERVFLAARRAARIFPLVRRATRARAAHPLQHGGRGATFDERLPLWNVRHAHTARRGEHARQRDRERGGPTEPPEDSGNQGPRAV
jgi:hypothetical protein